MRSGAGCEEARGGGGGGAELLVVVARGRHRGDGG